MGKNWKTVTNFIFFGSKITADGDCSHDIKTLAPWTKSYDKSSSVQFSQSVMSDSLRPHEAAHQASLSITNSRILPKPMPIVLVMPSNHLILCRPLLLLPPIPPSIRVFSSESTLHMRWAKVLEFQLQYYSFQRTPRTDLL